MLGFQELDRRHKGYGTFAYRVSIVRGKEHAVAVEFNKLRLWCWETFGPSCERDIHEMVNPHAPWAWHIDSDYFIPHIYLAHGEPESLFKLKWM